MFLDKPNVLSLSHFKLRSETSEPLPAYLYTGPLSPFINIEYHILLLWELYAGVAYVRYTSGIGWPERIGNEML